MKRCSSILLFAVLCSGCTSIRRQVGRPLEEPSRSFVAGSTHYHQVLDELGPPSRLAARPGGFTFLYESITIREYQLGISGTQDLLNLFKIAVARADLKRAALLFGFRSDGVLAFQESCDTSARLGMSGSLQPFFALQQVADTSDYESGGFPSVEWGTALLGPLPRGLNRAQSLVWGTGGVEQSGTTGKIGQHTLEMR